ncbi:lysozyme-like domain-containing protein [Aspergillus floccosus]
MKISIALASIFALQAAALPGKLLRRGISDAAVELIGSLEGFRPDFYYINGHKTVGYGHDCVAKQDCDSIDTPLTKEEGAALLKKDLAGYEKCVCEMDNAKYLNANQYGALVSFAYNSGCGGVESWWHGAMEQKNFKGICSALPNTNTLGGQLSNRRAKEGAFCAKPTNQTSGC